MGGVRRAQSRVGSVQGGATEPGTVLDIGQNQLNLSVDHRLSGRQLIILGKTPSHDAIGCLAARVLRKLRFQPAQAALVGGNEREAVFA